MSKFSAVIFASFLLCVFLQYAGARDLRACRPGDIRIYQSPSGYGSDNVPQHTVEIRNMSPWGTQLFDVHVACGNFATTRLVHPRKFKRIRPGDCLVKNGSSIGPYEIISFKYSNTFPYKLVPYSVRC